MWMLTPHLPIREAESEETWRGSSVLLSLMATGRACSDCCMNCKEIKINRQGGTDQERPKLYKTQERNAMSLSPVYIEQEVICSETHYKLHLIAGTAEITKIAPAINMTLTKRWFNMKPSESSPQNNLIYEWDNKLHFLWRTL